MNKFTSSERRGAIVILAIIACITIFLALSRGVGRKAPEPPAAMAPAVETVADTITVSGKKHPKKAKKDKSSERKSEKSRKKKNQSSETNKSRDPLNEPVSR